MSISSNSQGRSELHDALSTELAKGELISDAIFKMFATALDSENPDEISRKNKIWFRFFQAQELYQNVWNNGDSRAPYAIFYKLTDKDQFEAQYELERREIREILRNHIKKLHERKETPTVQAMVQFIKKEFIENLSAVLEEQKKQIMRSKVASNILTILNQIKSKTDLKIPIDYWLMQQIETIQELSLPTFYAVDDVAEAQQVGVIYDPEDTHNWGVNVAWTLGVARSLIPIKVISELNMQNANRSHPNPNQNLNPSAFSLEIAIAIKMGYGLNIVNNAITLIPPLTLSNYTTTGEPGNGVLPTIQEQSDIFRRCVHARTLHTLLPLNNGENLRSHIYDVCTGKNSDAKVDFIEALDLLNKGDSLLPVLQALSSRELDSLQLVLKSEHFRDPKYNALREGDKGQPKERLDTLQQFKDYLGSQSTSRDTQKGKPHTPKSHSR